MSHRLLDRLVELLLDRLVDGLLRDRLLYRLVSRLLRDRLVSRLLNRRLLGRLLRDTGRVGRFRHCSPGEVGARRCGRRSRRPQRHD
ncbi:hypothetical protein ACWEV3_01675 [Saccharopolyspora sp. NPDC003752]